MQERYHIDKLLPATIISTSHDTDDDRAPRLLSGGASLAGGLWG